MRSAKGWLAELFWQNVRLFFIYLSILVAGVATIIKYWSPVKEFGIAIRDIVFPILHDGLLLIIASSFIFLSLVFVSMQRSLRRLIRKHLVFCVWILALSTFSFILIWNWPSLVWASSIVRENIPDEKQLEIASAVLRNIGLVFVATISFPVVVWRGFVSQQDHLHARYQKGADMLASGNRATRYAGVHALQTLYREHATVYYIQVIESLCAFVRYPEKSHGDSGDNQESQKKAGTAKTESVARCTPDVETAIVTIGKRNSKQVALEKQKKRWRLNLDGVNLKHASLPYANLCHVHLVRADLSNARLDHVNFLSAMLAFADMTEANLVSANLSDARMFQTKLNHGWINYANLSGARLYRAELRNVLLMHADLLEANLGRADISGTYLCNADLSGARLDDAILSGADLSGADMAYVTGLTQAELDKTNAEFGAPPNLLGAVCARKNKLLEWDSPGRKRREVAEARKAKKGGQRGKSKP